MNRNYKECRIKNFSRKYLHLGTTVFVFRGCFGILGVRAFQKYHQINFLCFTSKVPGFFSWLTLKPGKVSSISY
jgi:hypothetical protein